MLLMTYLNNFFKFIICNLSQEPTTFCKSSGSSSGKSLSRSCCIPILNIINLLKIPYSKYIKPIQTKRFIVFKKK